MGRIAGGGSLFRNFRTQRRQSTASDGPCLGRSRLGSIRSWLYPRRVIGLNGGQPELGPKRREQEDLTTPSDRTSGFSRSSAGSLVFHARGFPPETYPLTGVWRAP